MSNFEKEVRRRLDRGRPEPVFTPADFKELEEAVAAAGIDEPLPMTGADRALLAEIESI